MIERVPHLPAALAACAAVLVPGVPLGWYARGPAGAAGVAGGVALVAASYLVSSLVVAWADGVDPRMVLPVGLGVYLLKFSLLGVVFLAVGRTGWRGLPALGFAVIAAVLAWSVVHVWSVWAHPPR